LTCVTIIDAVDHVVDGFKYILELERRLFRKQRETVSHIICKRLHSIFQVK